MVPVFWRSDVADDLRCQVEYRTHGMHSDIKEIIDRSVKSRRTMKGRDSATSFSSLVLDKSVISY